MSGKYTALCYFNTKLYKEMGGLPFDWKYSFSGYKCNFWNRYFESRHLYRLAQGSAPAEHCNFFPFNFNNRGLGDTLCSIDKVSWSEQFLLGSEIKSNFWNRVWNSHLHIENCAVCIFQMVTTHFYSNFAIRVVWERHMYFYLHY